MKQRIEEKLELKKSEYIHFIKWLFDRGGQYLFPERIICSRYFDNYNFKMFEDTLEGILPRKKIRIRTYGNNNFEKSDFYNLEIKLSNENNRYKEIKRNINRSFHEMNGIYDKDYGMCFPTIDISYVREYFLLDGIRITIDKDIRYSFKGIINAKDYSDEFYVSEIKADALTSKDFLLNNFNFPRTRFSKYERGMNSYLELF